MVITYVISGALAGILAGVTSFLMGSSLWVAIVSYILVGSLGMVGAVAVNLLLCSLRGRVAERDTDLSHESSRA